MQHCHDRLQRIPDLIRGLTHQGLLELWTTHVDKDPFGFFRTKSGLTGVSCSAPRFKTWPWFEVCLKRSCGGTHHPAKRKDRPRLGPTSSDTRWTEVPPELDGFSGSRHHWAGDMTLKNVLNIPHYAPELMEGSESGESPTLMLARLQDPHQSGPVRHVGHLVVQVHGDARRLVARGVHAARLAHLKSAASSNSGSRD